VELANQFNNHNQATRRMVEELAAKGLVKIKYLSVDEQFDEVGHHEL